MKYFINKITISGAKNIDKPIELLFSNKTISNDMDLSSSKVKAIYGPNGSGKSGIMSAIYIYKRILFDVHSLHNDLFIQFVLEIMNKVTSELKYDVVFSVFDEDTNQIKYCYNHIIDLVYDGNEIIIKNEELSILKGKTIIKENFKPLISINDGIMSYLKLPSSSSIEKDQLYLNSLNLLDKSTISSIYFRMLKNSVLYRKNYEVLACLYSTLMLSNSLFVVLDREDIHQEYLSTFIKENVLSDIQNDEAINKYSYMTDVSFGLIDNVLVKEFDRYEQNIKKLTEFIKIFKPDLKNIIIDKRINKDIYICDKIFDYGSYKVNLEFESTGIKKLVKLYSALKKCANGNIVFVDEMDSNLHDVYFNKIIEFFKNDSKGQLCFTTHNIDTINVLKKNSHSLDFISNDSRLYSWLKNGNKSPMNQYINGLVPYSPFNIDYFDFDLLLDEE